MFFDNNGVTAGSQIAVQASGVYEFSRFDPGGNDNANILPLPARPASGTNE